MNTDDRDWEDALWREDADRLQELIKHESPSNSLHKLEVHIRQLYMRSELEPEFELKNVPGRVQQFSTMLSELRRQIGGWYQRQEHDLGTLQWLRRSSVLSVVLGAGATIDAGGPSWSELVKKLLVIAINKGRQIHNNLLQPDRTRRLSLDAKTEPSRIHRSLAKVAALFNKGRPGFSAVINYNFDSLISEAFAEEGVPYRCYFMANRKIESFAPPSNPENLESILVVHLHGFTPRRPFFDLRGIDFVFSTKQFDELYNDWENTIVGEAVNKYIRHPAFVALYIGCSFTDQAMNDVLQEAAKRFPDRPHYAFLELPTEALLTGDSAIREPELRYKKMGIQPIWFRNHREIPAMIDQLA